MQRLAEAVSTVHFWPPWQPDWGTMVQPVEDVHPAVLSVQLALHERVPPVKPCVAQVLPPRLLPSQASPVSRAPLPQVGGVVQSWGQIVAFSPVSQVPLVQ